MSSPELGRFWQIDPLAEDYIYNSTYAFQENKLGMGIELEGLELVDSNGRLLYDPSLNNGKGGFTDAANGNVRKIINTLRSTDQGEQQFQKTFDHKIELIIDNSTSATDLNKAGSTANKEVNWATYTDGTYAEGTGSIGSSAITIFVNKVMELDDTINDDDPNTIALLGINNKEIPENLTFVDILAAVLGHEIEHTTVGNAVKREIDGNDINSEKDASNISDILLDQLEQNKKQK